MHHVKINKKDQGQQGNVLLITTILVLILSIIVATTINVANGEAQLSDLKRDTSNTYLMASEAVEKQVDTINKALEIEMPHIVQNLSDTYIADLVSGTDLNSKFKYKDGKLSIKDTTGFCKELQEKIFAFLEVHYLDDGTNSKTITYEMQSDRKEKDYKTIITVTSKKVGTEKDKIQVEASAVTKDASGNVFDQQDVEAIVDISIPDELKQEIREYYKWKGKPCEVLDIPIITFSDLIVTGGNTLTVKSGDVLVKGYKKASSATSPADADENSGVVVTNGGTLTVKDNLLCDANIVASNGWGQSSYGAATTINVGKDAIAHTVGILNDFYTGGPNQMPYSNKVSNININVGNNVIVDNDVMIDRFVYNSHIAVGTNDGGATYTGTIFGTGGGTGVTDPNLSSGVFCQGDEGSAIKTGRVLIAGQPFIVLEESGKAYKLFESVGEPFEGVHSIPEYNDDDTSKVTKDLYLYPDSIFMQYIQTDKIKLGSPISNSYAIEGISCTDSTNTQYKGKEQKLLPGGDSALWEILFNKAGVAISTYTSKDSEYTTEPLKTLFDAAGQVKFFTGTAGTMYEKQFEGFNSGLLNTFGGVKAYSTAMRGFLYKGFSSGKLVTQSFDNVVKYSVFSEDHDWSYDVPILVHTSGDMTVDIDTMYVTGDYDELDFDGDGTLNKDESEVGSYPSVLINAGDGKLTVKSSSGGKTFNGLIISKGPVELNNVIINGSVITGGPQGAPTNTGIFASPTNAGISISGTVEINKAPNVLFQVESKDRELFRSVLNALKVTQYVADTNVTKIIGNYEDTDVKYVGAGKLKYTERSYLYVDTKDVQLKIAALKKKQ